MSTADHIRLNKRLVLLGLWVLLIAGLFWTSSRYPDLNSKALLGGDAMLEDPLSFEAAFELQGDDSPWQRVLLTTLNWLHTNLRGMAFGLLLGAGMLVLMGMLKRRGVRSGLGNTLLGMGIGTPLGVCVNCAAPIAKGIHHAGGRLETTLAAMVSSPTLNVIVLTMAFSILPVYLALTKLAFTLLFILLVIPILSRSLFWHEQSASLEIARCAVEELPPVDIEESWIGAARTAAREYVASLWFIVRTTVPLMFLAAVLGSLLVTFLPLHDFAQMGAGFLTVAGLSLFGLFLPVPMAFDVIVSAVLLAAGLPVLHVMVLLFVLGIFSCYSAFILATTVSVRVAVVLSFVLCSMGVLAGYTADAFHRGELQGMIAFVRGSEPSSTEADFLPDSDQSFGDWNLKQEPKPLPSGPASLSVTRREDRPRSPSSPLAFTRTDGEAWGLEAPRDFSADQFWPPFFNGRGLASSDLDGDGWLDIVVATREGIRIYQNQEGNGFEAVTLDVEGLSALDVFVVAPVDLNDDGWLDLYLTTYRSGVYVLPSLGGSFENSALHRIPTHEAILTHAVAFGDIDRDGDLDAALGNWSYGLAKPEPPLSSQNFLHRNERGEFRTEPLSGPLGETLSVLFSDWDGDGNLDLIVGNDFEEPDVYYLGSGDGEFLEVQQSDELVPVSTMSTMSIDTADINNDLSLEIYLTQIAAGVSTPEKLTEPRGLEFYCSDVEDLKTREFCQRNLGTRKLWAFGAAHRPAHVRSCSRISDEAEREACRGMRLMQTAIRERDSSLCEYISLAHERGRYLCEAFFVPGVKLEKDQLERAIPQTGARNVLLFRQGEAFENRAQEMDVEVTGWSWNGKFADYDNDSWQDVYVVNGTWLHPGKAPSNILFHNLNGQRFEDATEEFGLEDKMVVSAYTMADIDNDGDLDIITNTVNGPLRVYQNNETLNHSVAFELRDHRGNRFGIGAKLVIHYGPDAALHQVRELKSGGGFLSFDPLIAHFGLGEFDQVTSVDVIWPDGTTNSVEGPLQAGSLYRIERK